MLMKTFYSLSALFLLVQQSDAQFRIPNTRFSVDTAKKSWGGCSNRANQLGMQMAAIHTANENAQIRTYIGDEAWIGLIRSGNSQGWRWESFESLVYLNWANGEPNNNGGRENYVLMKTDGRWNDEDFGDKKRCVFQDRPTPAPTPAPTPVPTPAPSSEPSSEPSSIPTAFPTTYITPFLVGQTAYTLSGGNSYFDGSLDLTNPIGSRANLNNVAVQLFDFSCQNTKDNSNSTNAVTISSTDTSQVQSFGYSVNIDQSNIGDDTGGFVVSTGPSTGDVKFCTRVSTWEGSIEVAFRETNFILSYNLTENNFTLTNTQIQENDSDSFITDVDTDFSVLAYQCNNYVEVTTPPALEQDENLVLCLEPTHGGSMAHVVHISNFNLKIYAGSATTNDYVEYNPVWFSTNGWASNSITDVKEKPDPEDVIMISTPVIAQFFIQGHTTIKLSGNCFLEFDSTKEAQAPVIAAYDMEFGVEMGAGEGCFVALMRKMRSFF